MNEIVPAGPARGLDDRQKRLVEAILEGKPDSEAFALAGYGSAAGGVSAIRSLPVQAALMQHRMAKLTGSMSMKALAAIEALIESDKTPSATRFAVSKWTLEQAGHVGQTDDGKDVPLHEMTADQLSRFMAKAQAVVDGGGELPVIAVVPDNGA